MRLGDLIEAGAFSGIEVTGVTDDSRAVKPGAAFFCVKGPARDGHLYAADALAAGAAVIITERDLGLPNQLIVPDTRALYADACAAYFGHPAEKLHLYGVTGTNGKTTVTFMLKAILEEAGHKVGLIGSIEHYIGSRTVPSGNTTPGPYRLNELFREMVNEGCDCVVMEVSSHALDQGRVRGLIFDAACLTNITQDHLDYHRTMENYTAAKKKLFSACRVAVLNYDDPRFGVISEGLTCPVKTYSATGDDADYAAKDIRLTERGVTFDFVGYGVIGRLRLATAGMFTVYNAMCATVAALETGIPIGTVCDALNKMPGVKGRAESVPTGRDFSLIIDYAHTPDGLANILGAFRPLTRGRLTVVFGCGGDRDKTKRPVMASVAARLADRLIITSDNPRSEDPLAIIDDILAGLRGTSADYTVIPDRREAIFAAVREARPGDTVILAGKGHETYQILGESTVHFDEREVAREALDGLE